MPDFNAKMHQNRLQRSPDPLAGFKGPTSKGRGGKGRGRECCGVQKILKIDPEPVDILLTGAWAPILKTS